MGKSVRTLLGVDVGATGIKAGLFDEAGHLLASASRRNGPVQQPGGRPGWMIWDAAHMWDAVCSACSEVLAATEGVEVAGVAVTGFGADGAPLDRSGNLLYPIISWHGTRTVPQRDWLNQQIPPLELYTITGYHNYPINTINRLRWLRENQPEALDKAHHWLMVQDYMVYRLTGAFSTEATIASTTMAFDLRQMRWSRRLLAIVEAPEDIFPPISTPGSVLGTVTPAAAEQCGIPAGTPVVTGGHDCEIGALGSGVVSTDVFIDITGTWEMIIASLDRFMPLETLYDEGIDYEAHTIPGYYLCQGLMLAGGVIEWILANFYRDVDLGERYEALIREASESAIGAGGVLVLPAFVRGMGPFQAHKATGTIIGLTTTTNRGQIARAALEASCYQLRKQLEVISDNTGACPRALRVLGGGTRNPLWLQMKADVTGLPVEVPEHEEVTLLGAAMLAGIGGNVYDDMQQAIDATRYPLREYVPHKQRHDQYDDLFEKVFMPMAPALATVNGELEASFAGE